MKRILFVLLTCIGLSGCGYTLVGQGSLPDHIETIAIPIFENDTLEAGVEDIITQALIEVYVKGGKVRLVSDDEADAILRGTVRSYNSDEAADYNDQNEISSYKLIVAVDVELEDLINDKIIWKAENLSEEVDFEGGPEVTIPTQQENEENALQQLAEELADRILTSSTEGF
jgi:outer membrane lipopolysaccharide assembly protein LptE/RlpB